LYQEKTKKQPFAREKFFFFKSRNPFETTVFYHTRQQAEGAHLTREGAPEGNGGSHGNGGSSRILSGCASWLI